MIGKKLLSQYGAKRKQRSRKETRMESSGVPLQFAQLWESRASQSDERESPLSYGE